MVSVEVIKCDLEEGLSEYRFGHSVRVAEMASQLAKVYGCDQKKAYLAGILHDIAKEFSEEESKKVLEKNGMNVAKIDNSQRRILHSLVGSLVAKEKYGVEDDICHAISCHTLGDIPMNLLDKILFVADKIEPVKEYDGILEERELAFRDLDQALILCIENNHKKLKEQGKKIHQKSIDVLDYLKKIKS